MKSIIYAAELALAVYDDFPGRVHTDIGALIPIVDRKTDTQAYVFVNHGQQRLYIAVRGSSSNIDWRTNFASTKRDFHGIQAHAGYARAAEAAVGSIFDLLAEYPEYTVTLTGHSLGGAVATLLAVAICRKFRQDLRIDKISLITFGQRKVSTRKQLEKALHGYCNYVRVTNGSDVAPRTPYFGFSHAGTHLYIPNGSHTVGAVANPTWFQRFSDRLLTVWQRVSDHDMQWYLKQLKAATSAFDPIPL